MGPIALHACDARLLLPMSFSLSLPVVFDIADLYPRARNGRDVDIALAACRISMEIQYSICSTPLT